MTPEEKIGFLKKCIDDLIKISPKGFCRLYLCDVLDLEANGGFSDDAPVLFSLSEQHLVIEKLKEDGFLEDVWPIDGNSFWIKKADKKNLEVEDQSKKTYLDAGFDHNLNKISYLKEQEKDFEKNHQEIQERIYRKELTRIERIKASGGDKINYALRELMSKASTDADDIRTSHYDLGFEDTTDGMEDAEKFLNKLKNNGCLKKFSRLADNRLKIEKVDIDRLNNYKNELLNNAYVSKKGNNNFKKSKNLVINFGDNNSWEMLTIMLLDAFKFKIKRGSETPHEFDFQKIGYTKTTSGGKIIEKNFLKDFLLVLAMNKGEYSIKGLSNPQKAVVHTRKKEAKKALMQSFGFSDDPFKYDKKLEKYCARFKILPPPKLRTIEGEDFIEEKSTDDRFGDFGGYYNESTPNR